MVAIKKEELYLLRHKIRKISENVDLIRFLTVSTKQKLNAILESANSTIYKIPDYEFIVNDGDKNFRNYNKSVDFLVIHKPINNFIVKTGNNLYLELEGLKMCQYLGSNLFVLNKELDKCRSEIENIKESLLMLNKEKKVL